MQNTETISVPTTLKGEDVLSVGQFDQTLIDDVFARARQMRELVKVDGRSDLLKRFVLALIFFIQYPEKVYSHSKIPQGISIADPSVCLTHFECGPSSYCKRVDIAGGFARGGKCTTRIRVGGKCDDLGQCVEKAFCRSDADGSASVCTAQAALNEKCFTNEINACLDGLACKAPPRERDGAPPPKDTRTGRCRKQRRGKLGADCEYNEDCEELSSLFCQQNTRTCRKKLKPGAKCSLEEDVSPCETICELGSSPSDGVCTPRMPTQVAATTLALRNTR